MIGAAFIVAVAQVQLKRPPHFVPGTGYARLNIVQF